MMNDLSEVGALHCNWVEGALSTGCTKLLAAMLSTIKPEPVLELSTGGDTVMLSIISLVSELEFLMIS